MTRSKDRLRVKQHVHARREKVFEAWTQRERMSWCCPEDMKLVGGVFDIRVGGRYRASMQARDGHVDTCYGTFTEILPDRRIAFTQSWEEYEPVETRVVVELRDDDGGTEVTLTQEGFADPAQMEGHETGWASTLRNLAQQFPMPAPTAPNGKEPAKGNEPLNGKKPPNGKKTR
jgi:uncharacterized protein YndB with AHSA1/START domain